jgi:hypothetical protein
MILVILFVGLFDMGLRVVVDINCTSKAHPLDGYLSSSRWSRCAPSGFFSRSPTLLLNCFQPPVPCCRVPQAPSAPSLASEACASRLFCRSLRLRYSGVSYTLEGKPATLCRRRKLAGVQASWIQYLYPCSRRLRARDWKLSL